MSRCAACLLGVALASTALACGPGEWLGVARHFEEIEAEEAIGRVASEPVYLVQVRAPDSDDPRIAGAAILAPDERLPARSDAGDRPVFVVGRDDPGARRFAARLLRAGFERVAVVRGGLQPWRARGATALARTAGRGR